MVIMAATAIAGLASSYLNSKSAKKANALAKKQYNLQMQNQMDANNANESDRAMALQEGRRGVADIKQGYQKSLGAVSAQGVSANRQIATNLRRSSAQATSRGYGRGSTTGSAQAGIQQQAAFNMAQGQSQVAGNLAGIRGGLLADQGNALAGGRQNIASILQRNAAGRGADAGALEKISLQSQSESMDLAPLGALIGMGIEGIQGMASAAGAAATAADASKTAKGTPMGAYGAAGTGQAPAAPSMPSSRSAPPQPRMAQLDAGGEVLAPQAAPAAVSAPAATVAAPVAEAPQQTNLSGQKPPGPSTPSSASPPPQAGLSGQTPPAPSRPSKLSPAQIAKLSKSELEKYRMQQLAALRSKKF